MKSLLKKFKFAQESMNTILDELENEYYRMEDDSIFLDEATKCLEEYNRIQICDSSIEEKLEYEYYKAKQDNASKDNIDWILHKIQVVLRRLLSDNYNGILCEILEENS